MNTRTLVVLALALGIMNPITAVITSIEHVPNTEPGLLVAFVVPWLIGAELVRRGRITAGTIVIGLLSVLDVVSAPGWRRTSALDWTTQSLAVVGAATCLLVSVAVLLRRHRPAGVLTGAMR